MFDKPTTFILGAGASWHYGYPTGEELIKCVIDLSGHAANIFEMLSHYGQDATLYQKAISKSHPQFAHPLTACAELMRQCLELRERLRTVNPLVIDYFLGHNPDLKDIGKLMIAAALMESEVSDHDFSESGNINRRKLKANSTSHRDQCEADDIDCTKYKDDWVRFVVHKLTIGATESRHLLDNKINFVTFNYDVSLERRIFASLKSIRMFQDKDIETFVRERVHHVYGMLREDFASVHKPLKLHSRADFNNNDVEYRQHCVAFFDAAFEASKGIRTISPDEKQLDQTSIETCQQHILNAQSLYILGYGFDEANNTLLKLKESFPHDSYKNVHFTNFGDSNKINKIASRLMLSSWFTCEHMQDYPDDEEAINFFINNSIFNRKASDTRRPFYEKSTRDVYQALEVDFDL